MAKFCKYAKRIGAEPVVITAKFEGGLQDETLIDDLPQDLEVHRVAWSVLGKRNLFSRLWRLVARAILPDPHGAWGRAAYRKAIELSRDRNFDAVLVSYGAPSALRSGVKVGKKLALPVIVDIRDFKQKNIINGRRLQSFGRIRQRLLNHLENSIFSKALYISTVSETYREILHSHYHIDYRNISVIYNGYDPEDFADKDTLAPTDQQILRYIGYINNFESLSNFANALGNINIKRGHLGKSPVLFEIIGANESRIIRRIFEENGALEWYKVVGYVPHKEAVELACRAAGLVLMPTSEKGVVPGKFCEYLGAKRPILMLNNQNDELRRLISENRIGEIAEYDNVYEIEHGIEKVLDCQGYRKSFSEEMFRRDFQAMEFIRLVERAVFAYKEKK
ncbi:glycosyltransferase [Marimonas sp. MJW-29]|uniref:Glycosyltransferase n=1 Tax=Sulfitobacter sediminis TaxID=3234186 RepID=A0ABV3RQJ9_9RHOB